jgi:hypothetical protein
VETKAGEGVRSRPTGGGSRTTQGGSPVIHPGRESQSQREGVGLPKEGVRYLTRREGVGPPQGGSPVTQGERESEPKRGSPDGPRGGSPDGLRGGSPGGLRGGSPLPKPRAPIRDRVRNPQTAISPKLQVRLGPGSSQTGELGREYGLVAKNEGPKVPPAWQTSRSIYEGSGLSWGEREYGGGGSTDTRLVMAVTSSPQVQWEPVWSRWKGLGEGYLTMIPTPP